MEGIIETSRCEDEVLFVIHDLKEDGNSETIRALVNERFNHKWKPQTVSTFLKRLRNKGYLSMYRKGRYCYYQMQIDYDEYRKNKLKVMNDMMFDGNINTFLLAIRDLFFEGSMDAIKKSLDNLKTE